jgi:uncharacterized protein
VQTRAPFPGRLTQAGIVALVLVLFAGAFAVLSWPSLAQELDTRPRLEQNARPRALLDPRRVLDLFFRRGSDEQQPVVRRTQPTKAKAKAKAKQRSKSRTQPPVAAEPEEVAKLDTARTVMVVGDFMASGLAEGLSTAYAQNPGIKIIDRSDGSSGFVRTDFHDWPADIKTLMEAEKPAAIVIMLGANDRQQMKLGDAREPPLSDNWTKEYQARTDALVAAIKARNLPFVWVGLPAFKSAKVSSDLIAFNDIYRKSAENAGGAFIDIWDGFVDENGAFVMNGPDMNGQPVRLRGSDGTSLSKAGKRKVAFYAEKPLNKLLGSETVPGPGLTGPETGPTAPVNIYVDRTAPMAIDDPELDGGQQLLGLKSTPKVETRTAGERLAVEGIAPASTPGRADDFGGARPAAPAVVSEAPAPAAAADTTTAIGR